MKIPGEIRDAIEGTETHGSPLEEALSFSEDEEWIPGNEPTEIIRDMVENMGKDDAVARRNGTISNIRDKKAKLCGFYRK